jgi:hypothetical protein
MITIAVAAVLMSFFRLSVEVRARVEVIIILAVIVGVFVELAIFSAYFWPGTRPHGQYLRRIKYRARIKPAEPNREGRESVG